MVLRRWLVVAVGSVLLAFAFLALTLALSREKAGAIPLNRDMVTESALLDGLARGAAFPFIDTTGNRITRAHIAITDSTTNCAPRAAAPDNIQVLVGRAGVRLVSVMGAGTNTGISTTPGQCVFHVTVRPGRGGVPARITDIVVVNGGNQPLTGNNTVTASAVVE
jgi:hypothetical protein